MLETAPKPDYAIVTEPTGLSNIWLGSMGILQLDIIVRGIMAHASATLTLGGFVRGGFMRNLVPDYFQFSIDRRILPSEDVNTVLNEIVSYIDEFRRKNNTGSAIDVNIVNIIEPAML